MLYHLTGVNNDPEGIKGASYLYNNLMMMGTQNLDAFDRLLFIKRNGGTSNRVINYDYSIFSQVIPASEINTALLLESERITTLRLDDRYIDREKSNVYARHYNLRQSNVHVRATEWIKAQVLVGTPYSMPIYGDLEKIRTFDNNSIKRIYNNYRDLSGIIMVISGKFDPVQIKRSINQYFASLIPLRPPPKQPRTKIITPVSSNPVELRTKYVYENWVVDNLNESFAMYGILAPSRFSFDYIYFDLLRYYLVDERISKLDVVFNKINKLDIEVSYEYSDYYDANVFIIKLSAKNRSNLEKAKYYLVKKLEAISKGKHGGISAGELRTIKTLMELDFLKQMTLLEKRAQFLAEQYFVFGDLDAENKYLERIRKITGYDIFRISRKYLQKNNRVNVNVYPK